MRNFLYIAVLSVLFTVLVFTCNTSNEPISEETASTSQVEIAKSDNFKLTADPTYVNQYTYYKNLQFTVNNRVVYTDSNHLFSTYYGILPIIRELNNGAVELLMGFEVEDDYLNILQVIANDNGLIKKDTTPLFEGDHADMDEDGLIEFGGYLSHLDIYCMDCDSTYYNPKLFYEMSEEGMRFDESFTKKWIMDNYGVFHGFESSQKFIVPILKHFNIKNI